MYNIFKNIKTLSFILLFIIAGCEGPEKIAQEKCDADCRKCITGCVNQCQESYINCFKLATPSNRSTYENCPYYGNQCLVNCPEKCISSKKKK